jgi:parvulin-like peptidyl-prolyl isomerase
MTRLPRLLGLFALVLALVTAGCGDTIRPNAATVNGTKITQDQLDDELEAIEANEAYVSSIEQGGLAVRGSGKGTLTNAFVSRVLTRQIFLLLVHDEVVKRKLEITAAERTQAKPAVVQSVGGDAVFKQFPAAYQAVLIRRNAEVAKLQAELAGGKEIGDKEVKDFYDANQEQFSQTCVSHILFGVTDASGQLDQEATAGQVDRLKGEAAAAKATIDGGADFAAVAKERSVDASNKDQGGNLECGPKGRFVPEFETAMDALAVGQVSDPVVTQFGVHLIKVDDRKVQSLEEATPQIQQQLAGEGEAAFSTFLQDALDDAKVTVNPRYGRFSKDGQSPGIIPPDAPTTTVPGAGGVTENTIPSPLAP